MKVPKLANWREGGSLASGPKRQPWAKIARRKCRQSNAEHRFQWLKKPAGESLGLALKEAGIEMDKGHIQLAKHIERAEAALAKHPSDFRRAIDRKYRLGQRIQEIDGICAYGVTGKQRAELNHERSNLVRELHEVKSWLRDRNLTGNGSEGRRAIDILSDLYCVSLFLLRFAEGQGYTLTDKEKELIDEARRLVEGHAEKRRPETKMEAASQ